MLGVGTLHLLPHAYYELGSMNHTVAWLLGGFLAMFFIERVFHFHHHDAPADTEEPSSGHSHVLHDHHAGDHRHDHSHAHGHTHGAGTKSKFTVLAAMTGLTLHSILDGVALAAGVAAERESAAHGALAGLAVFLVVVLHKPFDSMTLGALLAVRGRSASSRHGINVLYAITVPIGVLLFHAGVDTAGEAQQTVIGCALAFAAGTFLCISTSDLLPELQFHTHDRFKLSFALLLGVAFSATLVAIEESWHDHGPPHSEHSHAGHSHEH
jgi:zinc and cadmium transporter